MSAHARIGPSSLKRVSICPGSVRELEGLGDNSSAAAAEGSVLHEIAAECLENPFTDPSDFVGETMSHDGYSFEITTKLVECMYDGLDWLREQPGEFYVEKRVYLEPWMPGQFGTGDVGILQEIEASDVAYLPPDKVRELLNRLIVAFAYVFPKAKFTPTGIAYRGVIFDWKFGIGVPVQVASNMQLMAYALGFLFTFFIPRGIVPITFRLLIEQPRNHNGGRYYEPWDVSLEELLLFGEELYKIYNRAMEPDAPLKGSSEGCLFCAVKDKPEGCRGHTKWLSDMVDLKFEEFDETNDLTAVPVMPDPYAITPARRYYIVKHASAFRAWLVKLHEDSLEAARQGRSDPGSKMIPGQKGDRYFTDLLAAEMLLWAALDERAYTRKILSPAQAQELLKPGRKKLGDPDLWDYLQDLIGQDDGKPILVDASDPRPAIKSIEDKFDEMSDLWN